MEDFTVRKLLFVLPLIGVAVAGVPRQAHAEWLYGGVWVSNICRADANPAYYWVYPPADAEPVGDSCAFPDGTPGTVTPN